MSTVSAPKRLLRADLAAFDASGAPLLLAEIKTGPASPDVTERVLFYQRQATPPVPFGMVADPERIVLFRADAPEQSRVELATADILRLYEPGFGAKRIYPFYFETLVEGWLRDLIFRWKSQEPPGMDAVRAIGLLDRLQGARTRIGARLRGDFVR